MKYKVMRIVCVIVVFVVLAWVVVMATDTKILTSETKVEPGQEYYVEDWGNVGDASQASLVCKYFNGRKSLTRVFWYSPNNILGRDSCPFLIRD